LTTGSKTSGAQRFGHFLKNKGLSQKAIQLTDNTPSHQNKIVLKTENGLICIKFLTLKATSLIQPMDQGVTLSIKQYY